MGDGVDAPLGGLLAGADGLAVEFDEHGIGVATGEDAERYLRRQPAAGALFRKLTETNAPEALLRKMIEEAEELKRKKREKEGGQ